LGLFDIDSPFLRIYFSGYEPFCAGLQVIPQYLESAPSSAEGKHSEQETAAQSLMMPFAELLIFGAK
jgi:hypothetical protein